MSLSMNGYPLIAPGGQLVTITVAGHATQVRAGDVAIVLAEVARLWHTEVEPVTTCYGWRSLATNLASGGIATSNHLSGTALDINGGRHPRYRRGTFTATQTKSIRKILARIPCLRWGGDYPAYEVDEMHVEIHGTAAQVAAVAAQIIADRTPAPTATPAPAPLTPTRRPTMRVIVNKSRGYAVVGPGYRYGIPNMDQVRVCTALWGTEVSLSDFDWDLAWAMAVVGQDAGQVDIPALAAAVAKALPAGSSITAAALADELAKRLAS